MCCLLLSATNEAMIACEVNAQAVRCRDAKLCGHQTVNDKLEAEHSLEKGLSEWAGTSCAWFMTGGRCHINLARPLLVVPRSLLQFFNNRRERWNVPAPSSRENCGCPGPKSGVLLSASFSLLFSVHMNGSRSIRGLWWFGGFHTDLMDAPAVPNPDFGPLSPPTQCSS